MIKALCLLIATSLFTVASGQSGAPRISTIDDIVQIDFYDEPTGYYIYHPATPRRDSMDLVVFVHGYGAINPAIFGKWIEHLVRQGHCVLYPRYQMGILSTSPYEFVPNTVEAIHSFMEYADGQLPVRLNTMSLIGHSYGGVIIANLADGYDRYQLPKPTVAFVCQPGTGPFNGGVLESYAGIDPDILLVIKVGMNDATVGQAMGERIFSEAIETPQRILVRQFPDANGDDKVGASHYEPYGIDERFDNGVDNFTSNKARRVSALDHIDTNGYWKIFDTVFAVAKERMVLRDPGVLEALGDLGTWSDGTPLRKLDIVEPE